MARILAYTSPALGHMLPMSAVLVELSRRGHTIHLRTLGSAVDAGRSFGFETDAIDPHIEQIEMSDWQERNPIAALRRSVQTFAERSRYEVDDLRDAIAKSDPDALLIDINCWGAQSIAESSGLPWTCFSPYTPPLDSPGVPPFGLGLKPSSSLVGHLRDRLARATVTRAMQRAMLPAINDVRDNAGLPRVGSLDEFLRRAPLMLVASGKPFQYPQTDWGDRVAMIGPCALDLPSDADDDWLAAIDRPIVLVTTSSEQQADADLVSTAIEALSDAGVHIVATLPAGLAEGMPAHAHASVRRFVPHGAVLDRAVCAITHGGMGATQKALAHGVPVCVVPYGRDQFEVARRVEVAGCGTRLPATRLSAARLRAKTDEAMGMAAGARRVAEGFIATGGVERGADLIEAALGRPRSST